MKERPTERLAGIDRQQRAESFHREHDPDHDREHDQDRDHGLFNKRKPDLDPELHPSLDHERDLDQDHDLPIAEVIADLPPCRQGTREAARG